MKVLKRIVNIRGWKRASKTAAIVFMAAVALFIVLASVNVTRDEMMAGISDQMKQIIDKEQNSTRKTVTVTYNNFGAISYLSLSTSGAKALKEAYVGFAGQIYNADGGFAKFAGQMVNYTYRMLGSGENVLHGVKLTLLLTTLSMVIGAVLAVFLALGKISKNKLISKISSAYIFFFRGTPLLIQLFVVYFSLPVIFGFSWRGIFSTMDPEAVYKGAFLAALIAFSLNSAAYCAEIVRAAIQSISKGQSEAAKALGMTYGQTMSTIIIPQCPSCSRFP